MSDQQPPSDPGYGQVPSDPGYGQMPPPPPPPPGYAVGQPPGTAQGPGGAVLAEWWQRAAAWLIDFVILGVAGVLIGLILPDPVNSLVGLVLGLAYYGYMNGEMGQTVGKQALKIRVVHMDTGGTIGLGMGVVRYIVWGVLFVACVVPGVVNALFPLWDPQRQALHDKVVKSQVVVAP